MTTGMLFMHSEELRLRAWRPGLPAGKTEPAFCGQHVMGTSLMRMTGNWFQVKLTILSILRRNSSGKRSRISAGSRSCTRRAPIFATSTTAIGAGVATATINQSNAESANPPRRGDLQPESVTRTEMTNDSKRQQKHRQPRPRPARSARHQSCDGFSAGCGNVRKRGR